MFKTIENEPRANTVEEVSSGLYRRTVLASLGSSIATAVFVQPLDVVKTRIQAAQASKGALFPYKSTTFGIKQIYSVEGICGLYKGLCATVIASGVSFGIFRYVFDYTRYGFMRYRHTTKSMHTMPNKPVAHNQIQFQDNLAAGFVAGFLTTCFVHPLWLVKTRLEMQAFETKAAGWPQFKGIWSCISCTVKAEGVKGVYKGIGAGLGLVPHPAIQMFVYEELKKWDYTLTQRLPSHSPLKHFLSDSQAFHPFVWGVVSKFFAICTTYPLQVIRTRQQMVASSEASVNFVKVAFRLFLVEGYRPLFLGFTTHLQRACLHSGCLFLVFEQLLILL